MRPKWKGIIPALSTPTNERGQLDEESLRSEVRFNIEWGSHALAPSIVAGEFYKFTDEERLKTFDIVVDEADGRIPVLVGVHHSGTEPAIRFAEHAKDIGTDGIIIMAPYYGRNLDQTVLQRHFGTVAERVDLPIMIQDTGVEPNMRPKMYQVLAEEYSNVVSVKVEGANTLEKIVEIRELLGDRVTIIGGMAARLIFQELALGGDGNIPDACLTDLLVDIYNDIRSGKMEEAREVFARYKVWVDFLGSHPGASAEIEKETLRLRGVIKSSQTRGPNMPLGEVEKAKLKELLIKIGVVQE